MNTNQIASTDSDYPVTHWQVDKDQNDDNNSVYDDHDGPTLTMTLPPLLLHTTSTDHHRQHQINQIQSIGPPISTPSPETSKTPCPLCNVNNSKFYCTTCVIGGDFIHSSSALCERFCEKQLRFFALQRDNNSCKEEISALAKKKWDVGKLREDIKTTKTKIKYLKHVIKQNLEKKKQNLENLSRNKESLKKRQERLPLFEEKANRMKIFGEDFVMKMQGLRDKKLNSESELHKKQTDWILQLHDVIFPVEYVETCNETNDVVQNEGGTSDRMMMECLADAMKTSYVSGRWVQSDYHDSTDQYRIVTHVKHATRDLTQQNIAASYSLAAQFLSLAAAALQFPITSKLCWSDLGVIETSEARLASKLSRVNINIIKLCIKCGVDIRNIRSTQCLHNLYNLINTLRANNRVTVHRDLSEQGQLLDALQNQLETEIGDDEDSDDDDDADDGMVGVAGGGWESVTTEQIVASQMTAPQHSSIASSVTNTVSQFLGWGYSVAPASITPQQSPQTHKK